MPDPAAALTLQFLAWIAASPRTYKETMEAWRTSCPRLSIWEDAVRDGLVAVAPGDGGSMKRAVVTLTARGRALLAREAAAAAAPVRKARSPVPAL